MASSTIKYFLNNFVAADTNCGKVFCTTCGGKVGAINKKMTPELINQIDEMLESISFDDFFSLGEWAYFLQQNNTRKVYALFEQEANCIEISNIRQLDSFLFETRKFFGSSSIYKELLSEAITVAVAKSNASLIESLVIILAENIMEHKELLELAILKSKSNENIHRALYNSLRKVLPEVRGYVGDGTSTW